MTFYNKENSSARIIVKNISDFLEENHHIYRQNMLQYRTIFMRDNHLYKRSFSLLKDAIDYRDACLMVSKTPRSRGRGKGGNTKPFHQMFNIYLNYSDTYRVILATECGKIRKSFSAIEKARVWRDNEIRRRGVVEPNKTKPDYIQSYSTISDKSIVFADSDNIRDSLDNLVFADWEEFK